MRRRRVVLSPRAILDIEEFYSYVHFHSGEQRADAVVQRLLAAIGRLETLSDRGTLRSDVREGLRILTLGWATVAYGVNDDDVTIYGVAGRGRDLATLFSATGDD